MTILITHALDQFHSYNISNLVKHPNKQTKNDLLCSQVEKPINRLVGYLTNNQIVLN